MQEIYLSTDIEADGPIPGANSMLSLASAAYLADKTLLGTFSVNLEELPGAAPHPRTARWWLDFPEAYALARQDPLPPEQAMGRYLAWLRALPGKPVFVGYPAAFDFMWVNWYLVRYTGEAPFSFAALDIKTYAMALLDLPFRQTVKERLPESWFDDLPHTHVALDDALEQGALFCNMLAARKKYLNNGEN